MPCIPIVRGDKRVGFLCCTSGETIVVPHRRKKRLWCFGCRKRLLHTLMGFYPGIESYYGPTFWYECPTCQRDNTAFPGCG